MTSEVPKASDEIPQIKLIAFDQDDTALLPDGKPSSEGLRAIEAALEQGLVVSSVSGRNIDRSSEPFSDARPLFDRLYVIANNGGIILGPASDSPVSNDPASDDPASDGPASHGQRPLLFEKRIQRDVFLDLLEFIEENGFNFVYSWLRVTERGPLDSVITNEHTPSIASIEAQSRAAVDRDDDLMARLKQADYPPPPKMLILPGLDRREAVLAELKARFASRLYLVKTNPDRIEAMHADVNKKVAVEFVAHEHGISMDHVMAVGDGDNDLPMLFNAGLGVIMENAQGRGQGRGPGAGTGHRAAEPREWLCLGDPSIRVEQRPLTRERRYVLNNGR